MKAQTDLTSKLQYEQIETITEKQAITEIKRIFYVILLNFIFLLDFCSSITFQLVVFKVEPQRN